MSDFKIRYHSDEEFRKKCIEKFRRWEIQHKDDEEYKEKRREISKRYHDKHPEKVRERVRRYRERQKLLNAGVPVHAS